MATVRAESLQQGMQRTADVKQKWKQRKEREVRSLLPFKDLGGASASAAKRSSLTPPGPPGLQAAKVVHGPVQAEFSPFKAGVVPTVGARRARQHIHDREVNAATTIQKGYRGHVTNRKRLRRRPRPDSPGPVAVAPKVRSSTARQSLASRCLRVPSPF